MNNDISHVMIGQAQAPAPFQWLWKSCCQGKYKLFFWLLLNARLNTRNLRRRKRMNFQSVNCVLCSQGAEETLKHLFFKCEFAQSCWTTLRVLCGICHSQWCR
jgi:hypothetical protein